MSRSLFRKGKYDHVWRFEYCSFQYHLSTLISIWIENTKKKKGCGKSILEGSYLDVKQINKKFHPGCFKCAECGKQIEASKGFKFFKGDGFCGIVCFGEAAKKRNAWEIDPMKDAHNPKHYLCTYSAFVKKKKKKANQKKKWSLLFWMSRQKWEKVFDMAMVFFCLHFFRGVRNFEIIFFFFRSVESSSSTMSHQIKWRGKPNCIDCRCTFLWPNKSSRLFAAAKKKNCGPKTICG